MHPASIGNIVYNELELGPCTAMASVELLRRTGNDPVSYTHLTLPTLYSV